MGEYLDIARELRRKSKPAKQDQADIDAQAKEIARVFWERGWVAFASRLLNGEEIVFVKDERVVIPTRWRGAARYTLVELEALTAPPIPDPEELKQLHEAKRIFEGRIEGAPHG